MASQDKKLAGSAQVQDSSPARVAFDLMNHIGSLERIDKKQKESRDYWLKLYVQCHRATHGALVDRVLGKLL
jgi:hypothetical protein